MLVTPTPGELRLLSSSAVALWRALVRARDERDAGFTWFKYDLDQLRRRARLGSYSTAKLALYSLRNAGLVATNRLFDRRWISSLSAEHDAAAHLEYALEGTSHTRSGVHEMRFPTTWVVFVEQCRSMPIKDVRVAAKHPPNLRGSLNDTEGLNGESRPSLSISISLSPSPSEKDEALRADFSINDLLTTYHDRRSPPVGPMPAVPPIDPIPVASSTTMWLDATMPDETKVKTLLDCYRRACRSILGVEWRAFLRGDVTKSKFYGALLKACTVMVNEAISPDAWAVWRLEFLKTKRGCKVAPPINVIFGYKSMEKMKGYFRTDHQKAVVAQAVIPREHSEQLHRRTEVYNRWRGVFPFMATPTWYRDLRRDELRQGFVSPLDLYPRIKAVR